MDDKHTNTGDDFIRLIAHQLKTPLANMKWVFQELQRGDSLSDDQVDLLSNGASTLESMNKAISGLRRICEAKDGRITVNSVTFSTDAFCNEILMQYSSSARSDARNITTQTTGESLYFDKDLLTQVVQCFLDNAVKYTDEGDSIELNLEVDRENLVVRIADTGIGIAEEDISQIFTTFFRASNGARREGTGLGLSLAHSLITMLHGTIDVDSTLGDGTTFTITLPLSQ